MQAAMQGTVVKYRILPCQKVSLVLRRNMSDPAISSFPHHRLSDAD
jgi:hypothetical protein